MGDTALQPGPRARGYPYMTKVNNRASVVVKEQVGINLIVGHADLLRPLDQSLDELLEFGQQREQEFARLAVFGVGRVQVQPAVSHVADTRRQQFAAHPPSREIRSASGGRTQVGAAGVGRFRPAQRNQTGRC